MQWFDVKLIFINFVQILDYMDVLLIVLAVICGVVGIVGCVLPALPGPPLVYLGMWLAHWSGYVEFSNPMLLIWGLVALGVTIMDFMLAPLMTKRFGGSKAGTWGSTIGLLVGMFAPLPLFIGPILGPFIGAYIGEKYFGGKNSSMSLRSAWGSFLAFFVGTGIKLLSSVGMVCAAFAQG